MWDKLLEIFKQTQEEEKPFVNRNVKKQKIQQPQPQEFVPYNQNEQNVPGQGTLIGFDYLKGLNEKDEDSNNRRFINLNKLLRGDYNKKIETTTGQTQGNLRREDSE